METVHFFSLPKPKEITLEVMALQKGLFNSFP